MQEEVENRTLKCIWASDTTCFLGDTKVTPE